MHPKERCIWAQVRILHETDKAKKLVSLRFTSKKVLLDSTLGLYSGCSTPIVTVLTAGAITKLFSRSG